MATHTITLIPGDGIGPEVTEAVLRILAVAGLTIEWDRQEAGVVAFERHRTALPAELIDSVTRTKVALKGPVTTPIGEGFTSVNVGLRKALDLYANLRPVWSIPGVPSRYSGIDLVIVRENTEDLYSGLEHEVVPGVVESLKIISERASRRIVEFAFKYARERGRKKVTAVHKANIMKLGDGLFLRTARDVARQHTDIAYDEKIVDATCMHLVMRPEAFDVLVMPNLYGDIVSDLCAGLVGGLGVVPGANLGIDDGRLRGRPRQRARHRREEHGEPDGAAALGVADAGTHRRGRGCRPDPVRDLRGARRRESADARPGRQREHDGVHGGGLRRDRTEGVRTDVPREMPLDEVMRAVLARDEVVAYLNGSHGESGPKAAARVHAYLDELRTRQRYPIYRALKHPLYPILRKLTRITEHPEIIRSATSKARVVYVSNHRSHLDYLLEPLVLEDESIRPPVIAAGINLFGGPLGPDPPARHGRHPDPPQHEGSGVPDHAQGVRRRDPAATRPALLHRGRPQLQRRAEGAEDGTAALRRCRRRSRTCCSCRARLPTTWCSRTTSWRASR